MILLLLLSSLIPLLSMIPFRFDIGLHLTLSMYLWGQVFLNIFLTIECTVCI